VIQPEPERAPEPTPAFAELATEPDLEPEPELEQLPEPAELLEPAAVAVGTASSEITDTAALLRELSSLGVEDDGPGSAAPPSAPTRPARPVPAQQDRKKKRGLFGR
jgi:hypothetical protein